NGLQIRSGKASHPVVEMNDVEVLAERFCQFQNRAAKEREALRVIGISVELLAREVFRRVDEIDGNLARRIGKNIHAAFAEIERHNKLARQLRVNRLDLLDVVARHYDSDLMPEPRQRFWQCACYVSEAAGFCVRD